MSAIKYNQTTDVEISNDEKLHRLAVEAAKYQDLGVGNQLPARELIEQGKANGYSEKEIRRLLEDHGITCNESVSVPFQGQAFGEIWKTHCFERERSESVKKFREWLATRSEKRSDDTEYVDRLNHAYSLNKARERFRKAVDVDRWFVQNCENFTTVIVTYVAEKAIDETITDHASKFYPAKLSKDRYNLLNRRLDCDEVAGVSLLAPENPDSSTPNPTFTHGHSVYWLSGWPDCQPFEKLRDTFIEEVDGATATNNPLNKMIQVERNNSDEIEIHSSVLRNDYDSDRGARTSASGEIGANLPLLSARNTLRRSDTTAEDWTMADARDCPEHVEYWLAHLRLGIDGKTENSSGINRWSTFAEFEDYAQLMKNELDGNENGEKCETTGGCSNSRFDLSADPPSRSRFTFSE